MGMEKEEGRPHIIGKFFFNDTMSRVQSKYGGRKGIEFRRLTFKYMWPCGGVALVINEGSFLRKKDVGVV